MKKVEITTPCHEDWNSFTPTEKGGFCGSCQKDVIDFTNKSNDEIYSLLIQNRSKKMCGRFGRTQLNNFNTDYLFWQNHSQKAFQSRFILAIILVFGLGMFSCSSQNDQLKITQVEHTVSAIIANIEQEKTESEIQLQIKHINTPKTGCSFILPNDHDSNNENIAIDAPEDIINETTIDTLIVKPMPDFQIMGMMVGDIDIIEEIEPHTVSIDSTETVNAAETNDLHKIIAKVYPNPSTNWSKLELTVTNEQQYSIELFSSQGQLLQTLHNDILSENRHFFDLELNDLSHGIYLLNIKTTNQNETIRVVKN